MGDKGGRYVRPKTLPPSCAVVINSVTLTSWKPPELSRPVMGLIYLYIMFTFSCLVFVTVHAAS